MPTSDLSTKEWLTSGDVARILGWKISRARNAIDAGTFGEVRRTDKHRLVHRTAVHAHLAQQKGGRHGRR